VNQLGTQRRRLAELAEKQRDELAHEIQLAAEVQQSILPRSIPTVPGFEFAARMYPARRRFHIGGAQEGSVGNALIGN
jgi:serine phosphatase RsbU (regulator of sigma subunit)